MHIIAVLGKQPQICLFEAVLAGKEALRLVKRREGGIIILFIYLQQVHYFVYRDCEANALSTLNDCQIYADEFAIKV